MSTVENSLKVAINFLRVFEPAIKKRQREVAESCPSPQEQPVRYFLIEAWRYRVDALIEGLRGEGWRIPPRQLGVDLNELESWLELSKPVKSGNFAAFGGPLGVGDWLVSMGASFTEAQRLLKLFNAGKKGAPPKHRASTISALNQRLSRNLSWASLTKATCTCGNIDHIEQCEDRLRKRIDELEAMLRKYGWLLIGKSSVA